MVNTFVIFSIIMVYIALAVRLKEVSVRFLGPKRFHCSYCIMFLSFKSPRLEVL